MNEEQQDQLMKKQTQTLEYILDTEFQVLF